MRQGHISICATAILVFGIYSCAQTVEEEYVQSEEEMIPQESVNVLTKDYCNIDEFEDMDYYLFCDSWLSSCRLG